MSTKISICREKSKDRVRCYVPDCKSQSQKNLDLSFHIFPKPSSRNVYIQNAFGTSEKIDKLAAWKKFLRIKENVPTRAKICSLHFKKEDYFFPDVHSYKKKLKKNAVPSINLPSSSIPSQRVNKALSKARNERLLKRRKQRVAQKNEVRNDSKQDNLDVAHEENPGANEGAVAEILSDHVENFLSQEASNEPANEILGVSKATRKEMCYYYKMRCKPNVEIGIQVNTGFLTFGLADYIRTDRDLSSATGLESITLLDAIIKAVNIAIEGKRRQSLSGMGTREKVIMTLVKLKQNISYTFLALLFQTYSAKHCRKIFLEMLIILDKVLKVAVPRPTREQILRSMPTCFEQFKNVRVVVDCTEIYIETPKKTCCQVITYSQYKSGNTCKVMTGVTPSGNVSFISKYYGGRASDNQIFLQSGLVDLVEAGESIMVDKGFRIEEACARRGIKIVRPPFLHEKKNFSMEEARLTATIASARVHVERCNQRIKAFKITGDTMSARLIPYVDDIFYIICGIVNLSSPILRDGKFMNDSEQSD